MVPNMITLTAMAAGMTSIKFAIATKWELAVLAVVIACFMDAFDGAAARLLKAESKLGAELDSFSDLVCFGVAPALVSYLWALDHAGRWGWPVCLIFVIAVALRLSRFNIAAEEGNADDPLSKYFTGVPSPIGAGLALLPLIVSFQVSKDIFDIVHHPQVVGGWMLIVAAMMVSHIPTFSSKQMRIPYKMKVPALGVFGILIACLINDPWPTLTLLGAAYLFAMPFSVRHYQRKEKSLGGDDDDTEED